MTDAPKMTTAKLRELQDAFIAADSRVRRGPLKNKLIMAPTCKLHVGGYAFPGWVGELGANPLPPGEIVTRYKGSEPDADTEPEDAENQGYWLLTGPVQYVIEWYQAWLALLDGEKRLNKGE